MTEVSPPYLIHTNRELGMMLRGEKPLSVFAYAQNQFPPTVVRYLRMFDRHWAKNRLVRDEDVRPPELGLNYSLHTIYYALPGEEWRTAAMMELRRSQNMVAGL